MNNDLLKLIGELGQLYEEDVEAFNSIVTLVSRLNGSAGVDSTPLNKDLKKHAKKPNPIDTFNEGKQVATPGTTPLPEGARVLEEGEDPNYDGFTPPPNQRNELWTQTAGLALAHNK